jgi:hypothetical protein
MPLTPITLLSQLDLDEPNGDVVAVAELDDHIRQLKGFLKSYLAVSHEDWGDLKTAAEELTFDDINGQMDGGKIKAETVTGTEIGEGVVLEKHIGEEQVTTDKIKKLAVGNEQIANGAITDEKVTSIDGSKITGDIPVSVVPDLAEDIIEPKHIKTNAGLALPELGLVVVTDTPSTNKLAKIGGILRATLVAGSPDTLKFAMANPLGIDVGVLGVVVDSGTKETADIVVGSYRQRNGWVRVLGEAFINIGNHGVLTNNQISITDSALYLLFMFASVTGVPAAADVQAYTTLVDENDTELLRTTDVVVASSVTETHQYWHFGMATLTVDSATGSNPFKLFANTYVNGAGATFKLGTVGRRDAMLGIMGISNS